MNTSIQNTAARSTIEEALEGLRSYERGSPRGSLSGLETLVNDSALDGELRGSLEQALILMLPQASILQAEVICAQLVRIGSDDSVPALTRALHVPGTFEPARAALMAIGSKRARNAMGEAAPGLTGVQQIGIIQTLGSLSDVAALRTLARLVRTSDPAVRLAALHALGGIGSPRCAKILQAAIRSGSAGLTTRSADAFLVCASRLIDTQHAREACVLLNAVLNANLPQYVKAAAKALARRASV